MLKHIYATTLSLSIILPAMSADEPQRGELLYNNHCTKCHTSTVHVRQDRRANTIEAIRYQVRRWAKNNALNWSEKEVDDVVSFLNAKYYKL